MISSSFISELTPAFGAWLNAGQIIHGGGMLEFTRRWCLCLVIFACMGCGSGPSTATVTGTVTFEGGPVKAGTICFVPLDGIPRQGDIQPDGSYRVDDIPLGDAIIVINPPAVEDPNKHMRIKEQKDTAVIQPPPPPFPTKYIDMSTSDLRYSVKSGENVHKVEMKR